MQDRLVAHHRILGIDPGTLLMGYAMLDVEGRKTDIMFFNYLDVRRFDGQYARLQQEFFFVQKLIDEHQPTCLAIETQFVDKNPQTMIKIVHAQGVAIAAALSRDVPIYEYSPMKIKMSITGNGHSTKQQVADMLARFLHIPPQDMPSKLDATDALAIAYCHFLQLGMPVLAQNGAKDWTSFARRNGLAGTASTTPNQRLIAALAKKK